MIIHVTQLIEIILIKYYETNSTVMGCHEYQKKYQKTLLLVKSNDIGKYAVAVFK